MHEPSHINGSVGCRGSRQVFLVGSIVGDQMGDMFDGEEAFNTLRDIESVYTE